MTGGPFLLCARQGARIVQLRQRAGRHAPQAGLTMPVSPSSDALSQTMHRGVCFLRYEEHFVTKLEHDDGEQVDE